MELKVLGPFRVSEAGRSISLPVKQRTLLAMLALQPNRTVSTDRLVDGLWGEDAPANASRTLRSHVFQLRRALATQIESGADHPRIVTDGTGYRLAIDPSAIDAHQFERLTDEARRLSSSDPRRAAEHLTMALGLWQGPALADFTYEPFAAAEIERLEELRASALEAMFEARLALGEHESIVGDLRRAVTELPFREKLWASLIRALVRCGRKAEALVAFRDADRVLQNELGVAPGQELQELVGRLRASEGPLAPGATPNTSARSQDSIAEAPSPVRSPISVDRRGSDRVPLRRPVFGLIVLGAIVVAFGLLGWTALHGAVGLPPGIWKIGLDMPLTGDATFRGTPMANAVSLAIDEANRAGGIGGAELALDAFNDASANSQQDPAVGSTNTMAMVADPRVIAMVGPNSSAVAKAEIPITNRAGLLECSPSNTSPGLTKPRDGALDLRSAFPTRISYIRTAPADDIQGPALASFVFNDLAAKTTLVIDDAGDGREITDRFSAAYTVLGGVVVRRALNPGANPASVLQPLSAPTDAPTAVFFGGFTDTGAPEVRAAMVAAGHAAVPFVSWDGIQDGSGAVQGSYLQVAGIAAVGSYYSSATYSAPKADFTATFRAKFGTDPDEYSAAAYACAEVILASLRAIAPTGPSPDGLREAVRAYAVDPTHRYATVIGTVGFDANGDSLQQFVTLYQVDTSAAGGKGGWVIDKQQDYGPAP